MAQPCQDLKGICKTPKINSEADRQLVFRRRTVVIWCCDVHAAQATALPQQVGYNRKD